MKNILKIALRNINRQKKRSVFLIAAMAFSFMVVMFMDGMSTGAIQNMQYQIAKVVGGHVYIMGAKKASEKKSDDNAQVYLDAQAQSVIKKIVQDIGVTPLYVTKRFQYIGSLIFEGKETNSKIVCSNFEKEIMLQESIIFEEGSWKNMQQENAVLIHRSIADYLNVHLNDIVLLETTTITGQSTVAELQVQGIFTEKSAFGGISTYINLNYGNKIKGTPQNSFSMYSLFLQNFEQQEAIAIALEKKFRESSIPVTDRMQACRISPSNPSNSLNNQLNDGKWFGTKYMVASFYDFAPQFASLVASLKLITLAILFVLSIITMIGVSNTFKIIVHERKNEIGTMRACGVSKQQVKYLFIAEALFLSAIGAVVGLFAAILIMQGFSFISLQSNSSMYVFSNAGHFSWKLTPAACLFKFLLITVLTAITVYGSASRASNMIPAESLHSGK